METKNKSKKIDDGSDKPFLGHRLGKAMDMLGLRVRTAQEPTTGYWFAYVGYDDGKYTTCATCCGAQHKTEIGALNALTKIVIRLINTGKLTVKSNE